MPLSQRDQYSNRKGMNLVRIAGAICLGAFLFGSICFAIVATMGDGEDPPPIYQQLGGASCAIFTLGLILGVIGWLISLNQPEPPKPTAASAGITFDDEDEDEEDEEDEASTDPDEPSAEQQSKKPDPYASEHRRREF